MRFIKSRFIVSLIIIFFCLLISTLKFSASTFTYDDNYKSQSVGELESEEQVKSISVPPNYEQIAKDGQIELYLDKKVGTFAIKNTESDYTWFSNPSEIKGKVNDQFRKYLTTPIIFEYYNNDKSITRATLLDEKVNYKTTVEQNKIKLAVNLADKLKFEVIVSLEDEKLVVEIPADKISDEEKYQLLSISVAPYFGTVYGDEVPGYLAVPVSNGYLIRYEKGDNYSGVFTADAEVNLRDPYSHVNWLSFPMYGNIHGVGQNAFYTEVIKGSEMTTFEAKKAGYDTNYTSGSFVAKYRQKYDLEIGQDQLVPSVTDLYQYDYRQEYTFVNGTEASYAKIAALYRNDLIKAKELTVANNTQYKTQVEIIGTAAKQSVFWKVNNQLTTYNNISDISTQFRERALHPNFVLNASQNKGQTDFNFNDYSSDFGNDKELEQMFKTLATNEHELILEVPLDVIASNTNVPSNAEQRSYETGDILKRESVNGQEKIVTGQYIAENIEKILNDLPDKRFAKLQISPPIPEFDGKGVSDISYEESAEQIINMITEDEYNYQYKFAGYLPKYNSQAESYSGLNVRGSDIVTTLNEPVPFTSIILSGSGELYSTYLNNEIVNQELLLSLIEYNVYPSVLMIGEEQSAVYDAIKSEMYPAIGRSTVTDLVSEIEDVIYEPLSKVSSAVITDNYVVANDLKATEYDNGTIIYINYSKNDKEVDNLVVPAKGYLVKEDK